MGMWMRMSPKIELPRNVPMSLLPSVSISCITCQSCLALPSIRTLPLPLHLSVSRCWVINFRWQNLVFLIWIDAFYSLSLSLYQSVSFPLSSTLAVPVRQVCSSRSSADIVENQPFGPSPFGLINTADWRHMVWGVFGFLLLLLLLLWVSVTVSEFVVCYLGLPFVCEIPTHTHTHIRIRECGTARNKIHLFVLICVCLSFVVVLVLFCWLTFHLISQFAFYFTFLVQGYS